jgi:hypothetical protein
MVGELVAELTDLESQLLPVKKAIDDMYKEGADKGHVIYVTSSKPQ